MRTELFAPDNPPDIFTFHAARELLPPGLNERIRRESYLASLPGIRQRGHDPGRWRYLLPLMPLFFARLPLEGYDLVISSSHAFAVQARPKPEALHLCYCYTPIRYAWSGDVERDRLGGAKGVALRGAGGVIRSLDRRAAQRPDGYAAISTAVRERIRIAYGRDAEVIHPPVDLGDFSPRAEKEPGSFLWVHRLVPYKRPEVVAEAFRGLPYRLTMVGVGPLESKLRSQLPPNVELRGWTSREDLAALYARSSGFLHVAEEDFGITMVEALAAGAPVIALDRGGSRDIVRDGLDGAVISTPDVESIRTAIRGVAERTWDPLELRARASEFSRERFVHRLRSYIADLYEAKHGS